MDKNQVKNILLNLSPAISGILMAVSFTFSSLGMLSFLSFIPLYFAVFNAQNKRSVFKIMSLFSLIYYVFLLTWLYEILPVMNFGSWNIPIMTAAIILIALIQGLYMSVATCVFTNIKSGKITDVFIFSALFVLGEWLQEATPFLPFPWGRISVAAALFNPFIQSASLFGSLFISFLIMSVNGLLAYALFHFREKKLFISALLSALLIFGANTVFGLIRTSLSKDMVKDKNAMLVQGNFPGLEKRDSDADVMIYRYIRLTNENVTDSTDIVVWPETAAPICIHENVMGKEKLQSLAISNNITLIVGVRHIDYSEEDPQYYNSMLIFSPDGEISEPYSKQMLVPFGEMIPLEKLISAMGISIDNFNSYNRGKSKDAIKSPFGNVGGIICYESIFPEIARNSAKSGADFFALISNDSWFGDSPALYQHHSQAIMRAVENKKYVLRASNTAVTSIISPYGNIEEIAVPFEEATVSGDFSLMKGKTLYTVIGDAPIIGSIVLYLIAAIKNRSKKKASEAV